MYTVLLRISPTGHQTLKMVNHLRLHAKYMTSTSWDFFPVAIYQVTVLILTQQKKVLKNCKIPFKQAINLSKL